MFGPLWAYTISYLSRVQVNLGYANFALIRGNQHGRIDRFRDRRDHTELISMHFHSEMVVPKGWSVPAPSRYSVPYDGTFWNRRRMQTGLATRTIASLARNTRRGPEFRIMTLNILLDGVGAPALSDLVRLIQFSHADIVGMQEVDRSAAVIAASLGWNYECVQKGENLAVLSRFHISQVGPGLRMVKIHVGEGEEIFLANAHLTHTPYQPYQILKIPYVKTPFLETADEVVAAARATRSAEVAALLNEVEALSFSGARFFATLDQNEPADWSEAAVEAGHHPIPVAFPTTLAFAKAGFKDAYRVFHPDEVARPGFTWTPLNNEVEHDDRIDFIYYRGHDVQLNWVAVVGESWRNADIVMRPYPTDHRGVVASFSLLR